MPTRKPAPIEQAHALLVSVVSTQHSVATLGSMDAY